MPSGRPEPLRERNTTEVVERIRLRLLYAGDDELELYPAPEDVQGVLRYIRRREPELLRRLERLTAVKDPSETAQKAIQLLETALTENARDRLLLVRRLRQLTDAEELAALETCRRFKIFWRDLAGLLGVASAGGAELRYRRLRLAVSSGWEVRTPRIAQEIATREAADDQQVSARHPRIKQAALSLLDHRAHFPVVDDLDEWWDGLAEQLDGLDDTPRGKASARTHLQVIVDDLREYEKASGTPLTTDPGALSAWEAARSAVRRR
jgi:hypothetical protein